MRNLTLTTLSLLIICFLSDPLCYGFNYKGDTVVVNVPSQGDLRGQHIQVDDNGDFFVNFFGRIPFAASPVGDLRFSPPSTAPSWQGERDSTYYGPACPQSLFDIDMNSTLGDLPIPIPPVPGPGPPGPRPSPFLGTAHIMELLRVTESRTDPNGVDKNVESDSYNRPLIDLETLLGKLKNVSESNLTKSDFFNEDCLYMNIYAPQRINVSKKYPVMLFIQGGGYNIGTAMYLYDGTILAQRKEVVVVTFNYRLGALGYLTTMDEVSRGNYGMLDQIAAMKWVQENIEHFGGDKNSVTIFGQSAGSASVGFHLLSPKSTGLFHRAIQQSGSPLDPWATLLPPYDPMNFTYGLADNTGCPRQPHSALIQCLKTKDADYIVDQSPGNLHAAGMVAAFLPVVDGEDGFLPDEPLKLMESGAFNNKVPLMMGYTKDEMSPTMLRAFNDSEDGISLEEFRHALANIAYEKPYYTDNVHYDDVINALEYAYTPWEDPENEILLRDTYMDLIDEQWFEAGIHKQAILTSAAGIDTYLYRFDVASGFLPDWFGVAHTEDLFYTFGTPFNPEQFPFINWTDADKQMSDTVQDIWYNFVTTGNPLSSPVQRVEGSWELYRKGHERLFHFQYPTSRMENGTIDFDAHAYWNVYDPQLVRSASREVQVCDECPEPIACEDTGYRSVSNAWSVFLPFLVFLIGF
ncbi:acetylcholinesterase-like [Ptychodera flava]|uniref:acetylcholinesterase-like n=1 Tax=Ptychodera flava TaxID=63121 RepID=UPI00396A7938